MPNQIDKLRSIKHIIPVTLEEAFFQRLKHDATDIRSSVQSEITLQYTIPALLPMASTGNHWIQTQSSNPRWKILLPCSKWKLPSSHIRLKIWTNITRFVNPHVAFLVTWYHKSCSPGMFYLLSRAIRHMGLLSPETPEWPKLYLYNSYI